MYLTTGLGAYEQDGALEETLSREGPARAYLRDRWADFLELGPRIIDLQHRAAVLAGELTRSGDLEGADQARDVIRALGKLNVAHGQAVDRFNLEGVGEALGLAGYYRGLGAVPVAGALGFSALALVVLWAFRSFDANSRKLDLIEAGVLTPQEAAALDPGPAPGVLFAGVESIGRLLLFGALAYVALQVVTIYAPRARRARRNPPLEVWHTNPPGIIGEQVYDIRYRHADDGENYVHDFGPGVELEALDGGTVILSHRDGLPLWEDFEVVE